MTWLPSTPSLPDFTERLEPTDVLYMIDEPLIFVSSMMLGQVICYKYGENAKTDTSFYIVSQVNKRLVRALKDGALSLRGIISVPSCWICELDNDYDPVRAWSCSIDELPENILPKQNVGLSRDHGSVPDLLSLRESESPFMSVNFLGGKLNAGQINLLTFKGFIDNTYNFVRGLTREALLSNDSDVSPNLLERLLAIPMRQPHLASVRLDIELPMFPVIPDKFRTRIDVLQIAKAIEKSRDLTLDGIRRISENAAAGNLTRSSARQNFEAIESIAALIPNDNSLFEVLEFQSSKKGHTQERIRIDASAGQRIINAYKIAQSETITVRGSVIETNYKSETFVMKRANGREVTCIMPSDSNRLIPSEAGEVVSVSGRYYRRKRRDLIYIKFFSEGSIFD